MTSGVVPGKTPAAAAALRPASTSSSRSRRVIAAKCTGSTLSSDTLTRSRPAAARAAARCRSPIPLVVNEISGLGRRAAVADTMSSSPRTSRGSPPVKRTAVMPSRVTAMRSNRVNSSGVSNWSPGSQSRPSAGMQ